MKRKIRLVIVLTLGLAVISGFGRLSPAAEAATTCQYFDYWNIDHQSFSPGEGHACIQFGSVEGELVTATFSPYDSTLTFWTYAGGTWRGSATVCYYCTNVFWFTNSDDKVGCYNHHTGTQWVNCRHENCSCARPEARVGSSTTSTATSSIAKHISFRPNDVRRLVRTTSEGSPTPPLGLGVPFASAPVNAPLRGSIEYWARKGRVELASLAEFGGVSLGQHRYSVVVGMDTVGRVRVAFVGGLMHSSFATPDQLQLMDVSHPMYVHTSAFGTSVAVEEAGIVGIARDDVSVVTVEQANGTISVAELIPLGITGLSSFTTATSDSSSLPRTVRAYSANGLLLSQEAVPTHPL